MLGKSPIVEPMANIQVDNMQVANMQVMPLRLDILIAKFAALAVIIHVIEAALPSPLPGVKPGLANVITLIVLLRYGWRAALSVALLRVVASSLLLGTFLSPTFMLSFAGALSALGVLLLLHGLNVLWLRGSLGPIALSATASMAHMSMQFLVAWQWFIPTPALLNLLPVLLLAALLLGVISGVIAAYVLLRLPPVPEKLQVELP